VNQIIEKLIRNIGQEAMALADGLAGRLLVYAEVEDGVISADMFYVNSLAGSVRFRLCPESMRTLIQELWERWQVVPGNREWRVLAYVIDGGDFKIDFGYPDQINENEDLSERRPTAVKKYFGEAKVDYSKP